MNEPLARITGCMCGKQFLASVILMLLVSIFVIEVGQNYQFVGLPAYLYNLVCVLIGLVGAPAIIASAVSGVYWLIRRKEVRRVFTVVYWMAFGGMAAAVILASLRIISGGI